MRLSKRLLELSALDEKNDRLKAYEASRQAINAKAPSRSQQADTIGNAGRLDDQTDSDGKDELPAWKSNPDEYRNNLKTALKLMYGGGPVAQEDVTHASELVKAAFEKYGSVDPMKMRQILRYAGNDEAVAALPTKGER